MTDPLVPLGARYGRRACGDLQTAESLEWLVTNGIGGYAAGTVAGLRTRRYHGLLVAALDPPANRTVMVTDLFESLVLPSGPVPLHASRWRGGAVVPRGFEVLEAFWLEGRTPVWRYTSGDAVVEKRIGMIPDRNATIIRYRLVRGLEPVALDIRILATYRDFHATVAAGEWRMRVDRREGDVVVEPFDGAHPLRVSVDGMDLLPHHEWYYGFDLGRERDRGLDHLDDALHVATANAALIGGRDVSLTLAADDERNIDGRGRGPR